jgi:alpha-beta hydrolase superfamily lysophospholipase
LFDAVERVNPSSRSRRFEYAPGAPTIVLLHGLTATPSQFDGLAPLLHARGRNVIVPRLPRHGYYNRMTRALADLEIAELIATVKVALRDARELGGHVTLAGFSLGGLLAAYAAQRESVDRVVCIAPFFGVRFLSRSLNRFCLEMLKAVPDLFMWWNPIRRDSGNEGDGYPRYPVSALRKAYTLGQAILDDARRHPPRAHSIAVVTNPGETSCHNGLVRDLVALWQAHGADVDEICLPNLGASHDFMTPRPHREGVQKRFYPILVDILSKK